MGNLFGERKLALTIGSWLLHLLGTAQGGTGCEWGFQYTDRSGLFQMYRTKDIPLQASNAKEVRVAVGGASPDTKELRITMASIDVASQTALKVVVVFGDGRQYTLIDPRLEVGPETDAAGRKWQCAWSYFAVPPAVWSALGGTGSKSLELDLGTSALLLAVGADVAETLINAVTCVNRVLPPKTSTTEPPVTPARSGTAPRDDDHSGHGVSPPSNRWCHSRESPA